MTDILNIVRGMFVDPSSGKLLTSTWMKNDFGLWGWNLRRGGHGTPYWLHTTPETEKDPRLGLANSHGCIHILPTERDRLEKAGFLREGIPFEVRPYREKGPP